MRTGEYKILFAEGEMYVFARVLDQQELIVAVNIGTSATKADVDITNLQSKPKKVLYASDKVELNHQGDSQMSLTIPPRTGCIVS